jgi:hypothetical protein
MEVSMKAATITATALLLATGGAFATARADTAAATCEVRADGKVNKQATGPCQFSQRQGYVDITLANGVAHSLSPADKPNQYKDEKGRPVGRSMNGQAQVYKWGDKNVIVVSFDGGAGSGSGGGQVGDTPSDLKGLVHGKLVGGEVDDELTKRGWTQGKSDVQGDDVWSYWSKGNRCVVVKLGAKRRVESIANGVAADCGK